MMFKLQQGKDDIIGYTRSKAMIKGDELKGAHFSLNCAPHSPIQTLNECQDNPVDEAVTREEHHLAHAIGKSIEIELTRDPRFKYTVEQPRGSALGKHPAFMR